ncbi:MAG: class I SAM-dependent methyltransferase [Acidobacteriia bacterium]|nr:class I SAM-dependent methyltransferase [Terriglobia bacterium]
MNFAANNVNPGLTWQERYLARFYDRESGWIDGTEEFHNLCTRVIPRGGKILEIGAGPNNPTSQFLSILGELHGLDPDPTVHENMALKSARLLTGNEFPFETASFDACVSNYVLEHVQNPASHLREVGRVLRSLGVYVFRTPNRFHYVSLVSSMTPHWVHDSVANRLRNCPAGAHDPYPTFYRMNSQGAVRRLAAGAGFNVDLLRMVEKEPSYGMSSRVLFLAFMTYERVVNSMNLAAGLRANIFGVLRKGS